MIEYGIMNENTRKLLSKDDSADQTAKTEGDYDLVMVKVYKEQKVKLGKILNDHGPYAPYNMKSGFEYTITLPKSDKIMVAQVNEKVEGYTLKNIHLEYETIENEELAKRVNEGYETGRSLSYEHTTLLKTTVWATRLLGCYKVQREHRRSEGKHEGCGSTFQKKNNNRQRGIRLPKHRKGKGYDRGKAECRIQSGLNNGKFLRRSKKTVRNG